MIVVLLLIGIMGFMDWTNPKQAIGAEASFETILKDGFLRWTWPVLWLELQPWLLQTSKSLIELENGRVMVGLPVPETYLASGLAQSRETALHSDFSPGISEKNLIV